MTLSAVLLFVALAAPGQAPPIDVDTEAAPATQPAPRAAVDPERQAKDDAYRGAATDSEGIYRFTLESCLDEVKTNDLLTAEACYRRGARALTGLGAKDRARRLQLLADTSAEVSLTDFPVVETQAVPRLAFGDFVFSGKAEFVATSVAYGAWLAAVVSFTGLLTRSALIPTEPPSRLEYAISGMIPLVGLASGLVAGGSTVLLWDEFTSDDASLMRVAMVAGAFNSVALPLAVSPLVNASGASTPMVLLVDGALMLSAGLTAVSAGGALAFLTDVPEGTSAFALSLGAWSAVLGLMLSATVDGSINHPWLPAVVMAAGDVGLTAAYLTGPFLPMSRPETWLIDMGAALGGLTAGAFAFGLRAPNPAIGWGSIAGGVAMGGAIGFGTAKLFPILVDMMPEEPLGAPSPVVLRSLDGRSVAYGGAFNFVW